MFYQLVSGIGKLLGKLANVQMRFLQKVGLAIVDGYTQTRKKDFKIDNKEFSNDGQIPDPLPFTRADTTTDNTYYSLLQ